MNSYEKINDIILEAIQRDKVLPWQNPFSSSDFCNGITGRAYNFTNSLLLALQNPGAKSRCWYTFKQIQEAGGSIHKGAEASTVCFFTLFVPAEEKTKPIDEQQRRVCLKWYHVFNGDQIDGIASDFEAQTRLKPLDPVAAAEKIIAEYQDAPEIRYHQSCACACYCSRLDYVQIPDEYYYKPATKDEFYSTVFHELGHSTGHHTRLDREGGKKFGDKKYAQEELVAELTSVYLCDRAGILHSTLDNSEAYLQTWYQHLKSDPKLFVIAAAQAEKAAKWILNDRANIRPTEHKKRTTAPVIAAKNFEQLELFA